MPVTEEGTEVGQLAESFNTMLAAVETQFAARFESEQRMRQFLADASHELRTPLTSIRGYAELARMQRAAGDAARRTIWTASSPRAPGCRDSSTTCCMLARGDADERAARRAGAVDIAELLDDAVAGSRAAFPDRPISIDGQPRAAVARRPRPAAARRPQPGHQRRGAHRPGSPDPGARRRPTATAWSSASIDGGPGLPPDAGRARLRAVLARRQGPHPGPRRFRAGPVHRRGGRAGARRHGALRQLMSTRGSTVTVRLPVCASAVRHNREQY